MQCEIRNCQNEATHRVTTNRNGTVVVCYEHLKSIIDGFEKLKIRRFASIQAIEGNINEIVQKA